MNSTAVTDEAGARDTTNPGASAIRPVIAASDSKPQRDRANPMSLTAPMTLATGLADTRGLPLCGRALEQQHLVAAGYQDLPFGRLYEGHVNALQLIARLGTPEQRAAAVAAVSNGKLYGVWNTEAADGVRILQSTGEGLILGGRKTFCSGADTVAHALITARHDDGRIQLVIINMRRDTPPVDPSFWRPMGMQRSDSFAVDFTGVHVRPHEILGPTDAYAQTPWFEAGAWRFLAVQSGGVQRLIDDYAAWLQDGRRPIDELTRANLGLAWTAARSAALWVQECVGAWHSYDHGTTGLTELKFTVDAARVAVERAALDVAERVERGVGARGLLEPAPFAGKLTDLRMYLRQPAPDQAILRVGSGVLARG